MEIHDWRKKIDAIDAEILCLLNKRAECTIAIGFLKAKHHLPVYVPQRETEILNRLMSENRGPLTADGVKRIFERIIDESRKLEKDKMLKNNQKD